MQIDKKKIMFVVPSLNGGGAEKVALTILESLRKSEEALEFIIILFDKESAKNLGTGINVRYIDVREKGAIIYRIKKFIKVIYHLSEIIKKESPCTILSFMDYSNVVSIISNCLSRKRNKVIISVHTIPTFQMDKYAADFCERVMGVLIKRIYKNTDSIIAVSKDVSKDLIKKFKIEKSRINVIHNPIDLDKIDLLSEENVSEEIFNENVPIILSVGRLSKEKGFDYLLRSLLLLEEKCNIRLVILGDGKEKINLKKLSTNLGLDKKVYFLGYKDNPYKYMKHATVFVSPSLYEGFGIAIVEAMACGIPVIATKSYEGIEEIIEHERSGLLVPVADEKAIAESILRLLDNMELCRSMSEEAKKNIRKFSVERITGQYKAVLGI